MTKEKARLLIGRMTGLNVSTATEEELKIVGKYCTIGMWTDTFQDTEDSYIVAFHCWLKGE